MTKKSDSPRQVMQNGIARRTLSDGAVVYYAVCYYKDALGRTKQAWLGPHARERDADIERTRFKAGLLEGRRPQPKTYTVAKLLDDWLLSIEAELKPASYAGYKRRVVNHIEPLLGRKPLVELEPADIERFKAELRQRGLGPAGQAQAFQAFSAALKYGVRMRKLAQSPAAFVHWPAYKPAKRPVINAEDAAAIIEATHGARLGLAVELILYTGLRRKETLWLRWRDLDLDTGSLQVGDSKTPSGVRLLPLPPAICELLKAHRPDTAAPSAFVFTRTAGSGRRPADPNGPLSLDGLDRAWQRIREKAGFPELHLHDLRHAFSTIALRAGVDLVHLAELLGHKDASITARVYSHVTAEGRREAADKVAEALRRGQESRVARKLLAGVSLDGPLDGPPPGPAIEQI